ncbi:MAG: hypothetical protein H6739_40175 [Alphaproteobacteria bacterium]|nr:hypothetical protein [Alphaproteobacteria bacterium]
MFLLLLALSARAGDPLSDYLALELAPASAGDDAMTQALLAKVTALKAVETDVTARVKAGDVAAIEDMGKAYEDLSFVLMHAEAPADLSREQAALFRAVLIEKSIAPCTMAREAWRASVDRAGDAASPQARERADALDPAKLPKLKERALRAEARAWLAPYSAEPPPPPPPQPAAEGEQVGVLMAASDAEALNAPDTVIGAAPRPPRNPEDVLYEAMSSPDARACANARDW